MRVQRRVCGVQNGKRRLWLGIPIRGRVIHIHHGPKHAEQGGAVVQRKLPSTGENTQQHSQDAAPNVLNSQALWKIMLRLGTLGQAILKLAGTTMLKDA